MGGSRGLSVKPGPRTGKVRVPGQQPWDCSCTPSLEHCVGNAATGAYGCHLIAPIREKVPFSGPPSPFVSTNAVCRGALARVVALRLLTWSLWSRQPGPSKRSGQAVVLAPIHHGPSPWGPGLPVLVQGLCHRILTDSCPCVLKATS